MFWNKKKEHELKNWVVDYVHNAMSLHSFDTKESIRELLTVHDDVKVGCNVLYFDKTGLKPGVVSYVRRHPKGHEVVGICHKDNLPIIERGANEVFLSPKKPCACLR